MVCLIRKFRANYWEFRWKAVNESEDFSVETPIYLMSGSLFSLKKAI
jgi:hypothetical protein